MGEPDWVFVEAGGYYRLNYSGSESFDELERLFHVLVEHSDRTGCKRYLIDLRSLKETFSFPEKYDLAEYFASLIGPRFRISMLYDKTIDIGFLGNAGGKMDFFENVAVNRGSLGLRMTDDEAAAIRWISA